MALMAVDTGGGDFELTPTGNHMARCYAVVDLGMQSRSFQGVESEKRIVRISWELPNELMGDGRPFSISQNYTLSLSEKANLRKDLQSWRGRPFTEDELKGFDLFTVIGVPAMINVIHKPNADGSRTYANVGSVSPIPKGFEVPDAVNDPIQFSLDEYDDAVFRSLPDWLQGKINVKGVQTPHAVHEPDHPPVASYDEINDVPF